MAGYARLRYCFYYSSGIEINFSSVAGIQEREGKASKNGLANTHYVFTIFVRCPTCFKCAADDLSLIGILYPG